MEISSNNTDEIHSIKNKISLDPITVKQRCIALSLEIKNWHDALNITNAKHINISYEQITDNFDEIRNNINNVLDFLDAPKVACVAPQTIKLLKNKEIFIDNYNDLIFLERKFSNFYNIFEI